MLVLNSCTQTYNPETVNIFVGVKGVELEFVGDSPPREVYENTDFPLAVFVSNEGAFSLNGSTYKGILSYSYDSFYLSTIDGTSSQDDLNIALEGKSYFNSKGDFETKILPMFRAKQITGQREQPTTELFVSVCYPYKTFLSDELCIDTSHLTQDTRARVCDAEDKFYTGQGAPVVVTNVELEMQVSAYATRPSLLIKIENKGSGMVLAPVADSELNKACEVQKDSDKKQNWNKVKVSAILSGEKLTCTPEVVNLRNEKGFSRCYLASGGFGGSLNYYANMIIELDYVYSTSISKKIDVIRSGLPVPQLIQGSDCEYWESEYNGQCVNNCDLCAKGAGFSFCGSITGNDWGCNCNMEECITQISAYKITQLAQPLGLKSGNCIFGPGLCQSGKYCCIKQ
ncbi:MAG: hypothetical protein KKF65_02510 [Nanoarchaeota archaeon]|nr:hypothetical protein [Nanoarchaeota archaeon]